MYLSLALRPRRDMAEWPTLSFVAALALHGAISSFFTDLPIGLKWPNDLLINHQKISGILLEAKRDFLVIGCGVNLKNAPQIDGARFPPSDLYQQTGTLLAPERLAERFLDVFYELYQGWQAAGFSDCYDLYTSHLLFVSQQVSVTQNDQLVTGLMQGITKQGHLRLQDKAGQVITLSAGDVNLLG